jgi:hypothetical protein
MHYLGAGVSVQRLIVSNRRDSALPASLCACTDPCGLMLSNVLVSDSMNEWLFTRALAAQHSIGIHIWGQSQKSKTLSSSILRRRRFSFSFILQWFQSLHCLISALVILRSHFTSSLQKPASMSL